ncbi:MAG: aromatic amino acid transport family protein [Patescibacteria group bacterium]|jgi:amino acid permease
MKNKKFFYALATFVGTVIGVGLFGIPFVGAQAGFSVLLFYLLILGVVVVCINLFFAEVSVFTKGLHRLPGYVEAHFGINARRFSSIVHITSLLASLLAYLIIGGQFLASFFNGSVYLYTFIFFVLGALLIWRGQGSVGPIELVLLVILLAVVLFLFFAGFGKISAENFSGIDWKSFFLPYGVVLFSLWGTSIIPEVKEILGNDLKKLRKVLIIGIIICLVVYILFSLVVIGISGHQTTNEAIAGLQGKLGHWVLLLGYAFGIITTFTSFIALGLTVKKVFWYDLHLPKGISWLLASFIPLFFYIIGLQNFIKIISLTGAVMLGIDGILITLMFLKIIKERKSQKLVHFRLLSLAILTLLSFGVVLEIVFFFKNNL